MTSFHDVSLLQSYSLLMSRPRLLRLRGLSASRGRSLTLSLSRLPLSPFSVLSLPFPGSCPVLSRLFSQQLPAKVCTKVCMTACMMTCLQARTSAPLPRTQKKPLQVRSGCKVRHRLVRYNNGFFCSDAANDPARLPDACQTSQVSKVSEEQVLTYRQN